MLRALVYLLVLPGSLPLAIAQQPPPILRSSAKTITIHDGEERRTAYWTLDANARPDVYEADRTRRTKEVGFITDRDSIRFTLKPGEQFDLVILLNDTDSCFTRVRSAISPEELARVLPPERAAPDTIPFSLGGANDLLVTVVLNDVDTLTLMFHTGMQGVAITDAARKRLRSFKTDGARTTGSWGGNAQAEFGLH
ncbi:MAG TPA: hypothetical protein PK760_02045, partial [Flavobacteriales bacterium]|nr:hypothetical protein [Flavobacteriales bacterium]